MAVPSPSFPGLSLAAVLCTGLIAAGCGNNGDESGAAGGRTVFAFPLDAPPLEPMTAVNAFPALDYARPVFVTHASDGTSDGTDRLFVLEQSGRILVQPNSPAATQSGVFLDLTSRVTASAGETGLLGLAFAPDYAQSGKFYVYYTRANPLESVLAEFQVTADPDVASATSERILLVVGQPFANHNAGMLAFGPDDLLYVSLGDGGSGGDPLNAAQDLTNILGSVLRIDPDGSTGGLPYGIPADNPFRTTPGAWGEIWAYGLRNPWRFSFDRQTGEMWLADVGQGAREEINVVAVGANLGWPAYEGDLQFRNPGGLPAQDFVQPVLAYGRGAGSSVTGGYVYRGNRLPELRGAYVYGDFSTGTVWALRRENGTVDNSVLATIPRLTSFGEDRDGELLATSHDGAIYTLEPSTPGATAFPRMLSATGLFTDVLTLSPSPGLVEYEANASASWDGARVRRFLAAQLEPFEYDSDAPWTLPTGSVFVKHFEIDLVTGDPTSSKRLETRVLVLESAGWGTYLYRWNEQGTDAQLLGGRATVDLTIVDPAAPGGQRSQQWTFPSRTDCRRCHAAGAPIGVRSAQLYRDVTGVNQLDALVTQGVLTGFDGAPPTTWPDPFETVAPVADRARAWLQTNCAHCHEPGGTAPVAMDLRYATATAAMGIVNVRPAGPDLGLADPWIVRPGIRADSVLYLRALRRDQLGMPPLGSHLVDAVGAELVGLWLEGL